MHDLVRVHVVDAFQDLLDDGLLSRFVYRSHDGRLDHDLQIELRVLEDHEDR